MCERTDRLTCRAAAAYFLDVTGIPAPASEVVTTLAVRGSRSELGRQSRAAVPPPCRQLHRRRAMVGPRQETRFAWWGTQLVTRRQERQQSRS